MHKTLKDYFGSSIAKRPKREYRKPSADKCLSLLYEKTVFLENVEFEREGTGVRHVEFDSIGCLFAVGGNDGCIRVFDFDRILQLSAAPLSEFQVTCTILP